MWNKNERKGTIDQVKGKAKQAVGAIAGDDELKTRGHVDEIAGKVEVAVGKMQRKTADALARVARAVKR
jgi:uncharacterized protein YjbJ (UPF0337 family)